MAKTITKPLGIKAYGSIPHLPGSGHGAIDPVEGLIYRIERKGEVDFLTKYVRHDKEDGKYFPEKNNGIITWNTNLHQ